MKSPSPTSRTKSKSARRSSRLASWLRRRWVTLRRACVVALGWSWRILVGVGGWICRALAWGWRVTSWIYAWCEFHFLVPALCFACLYLGVVSTVFLPAALWVGVVPGVSAILRGAPLTAFPIAQIPEPMNMPGILLAAVPIALIVFKCHYPEWRASSDPLLARMLFAACAGVGWAFVWFRRRRAE